MNTQERENIQKTINFLQSLIGGINDQTAEEPNFKSLRRKSIDFYHELKETFGIDRKIIRFDKQLIDISWKYKIGGVSKLLKEFQKRGLVDIHYVDNKDTHGSIRVSHFYIRDQVQQTTYNIPVSNLLFTA